MWTFQKSSKWTSSAIFLNIEPVTCVVLTEDALLAITGDVYRNVLVWMHHASGRSCGEFRNYSRSTILSLAGVQCRTPCRISGDSLAASCPSNCFVPSPNGFDDNERRCGEVENILFASRNREGTCKLWNLADEALLCSANSAPHSRGLGGLLQYQQRTFA